MKEIYQRVDFSVDIGLNCECGRVVKAPSPSGSRQLLRQQGGHNSERKHQTLKGRGPKPGQQVFRSGIWKPLLLRRNRYEADVEQSVQAEK
jgi:hypothetical protein